MERNKSNILENVFFQDGTLRDIYVFHTDLEDWKKIINWIGNSTYSMEFYVDGQVTSEYENLDIAYLFKETEKKSILMSINVTGIKINCHFFSQDEIEFDIDPKQIKNENDVSTVFKFMNNLSKVLGKQTILSGENSPELPLVQVNPDGTLIIAAS
ncbi:hypothetical protein FZW96_21575 [Bacillus sp. BGMRC 2118]|nr:hypothetical protein FZW96_21575 [Bacillus sp. BGMRC 2118]